MALTKRQRQIFDFVSGFVEEHGGIAAARSPRHTRRRSLGSDAACDAKAEGRGQRYTSTKRSPTPAPQTRLPNARATDPAPQQSSWCNVTCGKGGCAPSTLSNQ